MSKGSIRPLGDVKVIDHHAGRASGTVASHAMVSHAEVQGGAGLIDGRHHVGARVNEGAGKVISCGCGIAGLPGALALGVRCDETRTGRVVVQDALETLVKLGFVGFGLIGSEERTGRDCAVPHLNLHRVLTQLLRSSKTSMNLSVATSESLSLSIRK